MKLHIPAALLPVLLGVLAAMASREPRDTPIGAKGSDPMASMGVQSQASCKDCHQTYYKEWKKSKHSKAWTDPIYQAALKLRKRKASCYSCHVPASVTEKAPKKPRARSNNFHDGITCKSCHLLRGAIGGPFGASTKAHDSIKHKFYGGKSSDLCLSCHNSNVGPVRALGKGFLATKMAKEGKTCQSCHMPELERQIANDPATGKAQGPKRRARSHLILGPSDPEFIAKAFHLSVVGPENGKATLRLENKAGHRIPALKQRHFKVRFSVLAEDGKELWSKSLLLEGGRRHYLDAESSLNQEVLLPVGWKTMQVTIHHLMDGKDLGQVFHSQVSKTNKARK